MSTLQIGKAIYKIYMSNNEISKKIDNLLNYVTYRLIGTMMNINLSSSTVHKDIEKLSNTSEEYIYSINTQDKYIKDYDKWFEYIYNNQAII